MLRFPAGPSPIDAFRGMLPARGMAGFPVFFRKTAARFGPIASSRVGRNRFYGAEVDDQADTIGRAFDTAMESFPISLTPIGPALYPRRARRGDAALPAGLGRRPAGDRGRPARPVDRAEGRDRDHEPVDHPPRPARFWPQPDAFRPERWSTGETDGLPKFAYFPFGGGNRVCIGEAFAWTELVLVLATIARRRRFSAAPVLTALVGQPSVTLRPATAVPLVVR